MASRKRRRESTPPRRPCRIPQRTEPYRYDPLPRRSSLRILHLLPGHGHDVISCRLDIVDGDAAPPYEAISYTWGKPTDKRLILCGGGKLRVPTSLRDILQNLRSPRQTLTLWADAVCINQQDDLEKGHQVKIMGAIFANATRVLAWLGKEPLGGPPEYRLDQGVDWGEERDATSLDEIIIETRRRLDRLISDIEERTLSVDPSKFNDENYQTSWACLVKLLRRPWFYRLWVVQEVHRPLNQAPYRWIH
ncbi:heterokaryon incompatibility protein-domain-containing protein [Microdochium trichocladiopsis]|uniref:Heterokaryon incompatibility protein-domain-containing protein n=1 Tax=Microdochium trichocladiopsis TaxID=1682393 RepID=A0A9P8XY51_9PEZI|nr:heterokaryon incompatibility protein-domain-containing protein [Microdochium trichocladiopsis]KAH7024710.1 heterokaryon incompatibility protein-domain-containing protein [Microdochium trichocladiopsis]